MQPSESIAIHYLANHPLYAPELARYSYHEWRSAYDRRGETFSDVLTAYRKRTNVDTLPLALVALHGEQLVGTVSLKIHDLDVRPDITPWLGGLFVIPEWRRHGVASTLINRALEEAQRLELKRLYLWTASAESLYQKLGWSEVERLEYCGYDIVIMQCDVCS
jgi:GNAT superfamily N-acetyltransferase